MKKGPREKSKGIKVTPSDRRSVAGFGLRSKPWMTTPGRLKLITVLFISAFLLGSIPLGAAGYGGGFTFELVGELRGEVVDAETGAPIDNVEIWGEIHSRVLRFHVSIEGSKYSYKVWDDETGEVLIDTPSMNLSSGLFTLNVSQFLDAGEHVYRMIVSAQGYSPKVVEGKFIAGKQEFVSVRLEPGEGSGSFTLALNSNEGTIVRSLEQSGNPVAYEVDVERYERTGTSKQSGWDVDVYHYEQTGTSSTTTYYADVYHWESTGSNWVDTSHWSDWALDPAGSYYKEDVCDRIYECWKTGWYPYWYDNSTKYYWYPYWYDNSTKYYYFKGTYQQVTGYTITTTVYRDPDWWRNWGWRNWRYHGTESFTVPLSEASNYWVGKEWTEGWVHDWKKVVTGKSAIYTTKTYIGYGKYTRSWVTSGYYETTYGWVSKGRQSFSSRPQSNSEWDYRNITSNTTYTPIYGWVFKERKFVTSLTAPSGYDYRNATSNTTSAPVYGWVSRGRQQVSPSEYEAHRTKPSNPSVGDVYYSNASPVYNQAWVSTPKSIEVGVTLEGNLSDNVELQVVNVPAWLEAGFDRGDGSGLTDGIEFDLRQENRLTTKLVLRPKGANGSGTPIAGSYSIKVLATSGSEAQVRIYTLNVETVFEPPYGENPRLVVDSSGGDASAWANKETGGFTVEVNVNSTLFSPQHPSASAQHFVTFTADRSGEVTIEATMKYVKFLWGIGKEGAAWDNIYAIMEVNGVQYQYLIAEYAVGSSGLDMPIGDYTIDTIEGFVDTIFDLIEARMSAQEFGNAIDEWHGPPKTYVIIKQIRVQAGQTYRIGVGVGTEAHGFSTIGCAGVDVKIAGFVESVKIR
ncbi:MAG: hypothetical protein QMD00_05290 [Hadesarchaea archaeon]|nr:hypothetical protein [Hadesarchaea archaeon]